MSSKKRVIAVLGFTAFILVVTAKLRAVTDNNTQCNASGGCFSPCSASGDGSTQTIGASQLPECSPQQMSNCSGGTQAVCGVVYTYSSSDCDPTTISDSKYSYSHCCTP
jgi:hypothetical protein